MAKKLALVSGVPRMVDEAIAPDIYDSYLDVVEGTASTNEVSESNATTGTPITLPDNGTYVGDELEVYLNGNRLEDLVDYNYEGTQPRTQVSFTFDLIAEDRVRFRIDRSA